MSTQAWNKVQSSTSLNIRQLRTTQMPRNCEKGKRGATLQQLEWQSRPCRWISQTQWAKEADTKNTGTPFMQSSETGKTHLCRQTTDHRSPLWRKGLERRMGLGDELVMSCFLIWMLVKCVCSMCGQPPSRTLTMCALFCTVCFNKMLFKNHAGASWIPPPRWATAGPPRRRPSPPSHAEEEQHGAWGLLPEKEDVPSQLTAATSRVPDAETGMASSLAPAWASTPKKQGKTVNKKWKYEDSSLPLSITNVDKGPYCILPSRTFLCRIMMPVKLWYHFEII